MKDKDVYLNMQKYISLAEFSISRDTQLRALQLLKGVLKGDGREIFHFAYEKMRDRWEKISQTVSLSKHFTVQDIPPQYCNFFEKVRGPSPGDIHWTLPFLPMKVRFSIHQFVIANINLVLIPLTPKYT